MIDGSDIYAGDEEDGDKLESKDELHFGDEPVEKMWHGGRRSFRFITREAFATSLLKFRFRFEQLRC